MPECEPECAYCAAEDELRKQKESIPSPLEHPVMLRMQIDQLVINERWLMDKLDAIHDLLCNRCGTWQQRAEQAVEAAKKAGKGWDRYEALRTLSTVEYAKLIERNLAGANFDDMVDELVKTRGNPQRV